MYINKLDDIVNKYNKYNDTYHITIKMKPVDVKSNMHNCKDAKFKISDIVRISKHKTIFTKVYVSSWSEEVFVMENVKNTVPWTYVLKKKKLFERFTKNNDKKQIKKSLELKK